MFKNLILIGIFFMMLGCVSANDQIGQGTPIINATPIPNDTPLPANQPFYLPNDTQLIIESSHAFKKLSHTITRNKIQFPFDPIIPHHPIIYTQNLKLKPANNNSIIPQDNNAPNTKNLDVKYSLNYGFKPINQSVQFPFKPTPPFQPIIFNLTNHKNLKLVCNLGNSNNKPIILNQPKNLDVIHSFKTNRYNTNYSQIEVHIYNQNFYDNESFILEIQVDNRTQHAYSLYDNKNPYQTAKVEYQPLNPGKHNITVYLEKTYFQIRKGYNMYHNYDFNISSIPIEPEYTWQLNTTFIIPSE